MRGFTLESFDGPPGLSDDVSQRNPGDRDVLVRVLASSVNGADVAIAGGMLKEMVEHEFPVTLGRDFGGTVEEAAGTSVATGSATRSSASSRTPT